MNPISKVTNAITHPVQTATTVAGQALGVAASGVRTTMRLIDRAAGQGGTTTAPEPPDPAPEAAPAKKTPAKKATKKPAAKKAPSARAATAGPALSQDAREAAGDDDVRTPSGIPAADEAYNPDTAETDLHQPGTEPLMDPATVKSVKSETEVLQKAAEVDKA